MTFMFCLLHTARYTTANDIGLDLLPMFPI